MVGEEMSLPGLCTKPGLNLMTIDCRPFPWRKVTCERHRTLIEKKKGRNKKSIIRIQHFIQKPKQMKREIGEREERREEGKEKDME